VFSLPGVASDGVRVGKLVLRLHFPRPRRFTGASYKLIKRMIAEACPGAWPRPQEAQYMSISPLYDARGRPLLPTRPGWVREFPLKQQVVKGEYILEITWAEPSEQAAQRVYKCLAEAGAEVDSASVETVAAREAYTARVELLTPAQFKVKLLEDKSMVVQYPQPHKLLIHALNLLVPEEEREETYKNIDYYVVLANAKIQPVTVALDIEKSTNWAVEGKYTLAIARGAPNRVRTLLGQALELAQYTGEQARGPRQGQGHTGTPLRPPGRLAQARVAEGVGSPQGARGHVRLLQVPQAHIPRP